MFLTYSASKYRKYYFSILYNSTMSYDPKGARELTAEEKRKKQIEQKYYK